MKQTKDCSQSVLIHQRDNSMNKNICKLHNTILLTLYILNKASAGTNVTLTNTSTTTLPDLEKQKEVSNVRKYIGHNCNLRSTLEYEEFSLMGVEHCENTATQYGEPKEMNALILKPKAALNVNVLECNLKASFMVNPCSYNIISGYRFWEGYVVGSNIQLHLSKSECIQAIRNKQLRYLDRRYYQKFSFITIDLQKDGHASGWKTLRGAMNAQKGDCLPDSFSLMGNQYSNHILQMKYDIKVEWKTKTFNIKNRVLRLNNHLIIEDTATGSYFDPTHGNFHWNDKEISNTSHQIWQEVAAGKGEIHNPKQTNTTKPIAILKLNNNTIALTLEDKETICIQKFHSCREAYKTASKDIYLIINQANETRWKLEKVTINEVDRLEEIKASSISIFLSNSLEIENSFAKISRILCEKSRNLILTDIKKYLSRMPNHQKTNKDIIEAGSTVYSIKCKDVLIWLNPEDSKCYKEPRIAYIDEENNVLTHAHIHPVTHQIRPNSTQILCNTILPYKIAMKTLDNRLEYFCRTKNGWTPVNCETPKMIKPLAIETLYRTNTRKIHTSLFDSKSKYLLDAQQWADTTNKGKAQAMLDMFEEVRKSQPFEANLFKYMLDKAKYQFIYAPLKWLNSTYDIFIPFLSITYIVNVLAGFLMTIPKLKASTNKNISIGHLFLIIAEILKIFFPIFIKQTHKCKCEEEAFLTEIARQVENHERTRFLNNLMS